METIVVDQVPFRINWDHLLMTARMPADSEDVPRLREMAEHAEKIARPRAIYGPAYIESKGDNSLVINGITFTSRVLRVNLDAVHRVFPYVATCGMELESWSDGLGDMLESFWADIIKRQALNVAVTALVADLNSRFEPGDTSTMNPGSIEDWPMSEQRPLFALLGGVTDQIGVTLRESFLMIPTKSVSGVRFPTEVKYENCQLCSRPDCPGRRAPYDPGLYSRKYRK